MCRHLAYLGPPLALSTLVLDPPHNLARQAWAPRLMRGSGTLNADGFGVGWYADGRPVRYRRDRPIWTDPGLPPLLATVESPVVLAAVRSASPGMPVDESACAPLAGDGWMFSLNGRVTGWPDSMAPLAAGLPVTDLLTMEATLDSALVWALVRRRLRSGADPAGAVARTTAEVAAAAPGSYLNLLLAGPDTVVATAAGHSLSVRAGDGAVTIASEPVDDDAGWEPVPDATLVVANKSDVDVSQLPIDRGALP